MRQLGITGLFIILSCFANGETQGLHIGDYVTELFGYNSGPHRVVEISSADRYRLSDGKWYRKGNLKKHPTVPLLNGYQAGDIIQVKGEESSNIFNTDIKIENVTNDGLIISGNKASGVEDVHFAPWFKEIRDKLSKTKCENIPSLNRKISEKISRNNLKIKAIQMEAKDEGYSDQEFSKAVYPLGHTKLSLAKQFNFVKANSEAYCLRTINHEGEQATNSET